MHHTPIKVIVLLLFLLLPGGQALNAQAVILPASKSTLKNGVSALVKKGRITSSASARFTGPLSPQVSAQITKTLDMRMIRSAERLAQIQEKYPINRDFWFTYQPAYTQQALSEHFQNAPQEMYPEISFLKTQEQLELYFLANHNREGIKWYPKLYTHYQEIANRLEDFSMKKTPITHSPEQDDLWLLEQLPDDISYLLLGDFHTFSDIMLRVAYLLHYIRQCQPERKIIMLTEFIQEMHKWTPTADIPMHPAYKDLWAELDKRGIEVYGLEPQYVVQNQAELVKLNASNEFTGTPAMATIEAVRLRNAHFLKTIEHFRQQYPDALIVVYAGSAHLEYSQPYSLGDALAGPQTRVISFSPVYGLYAKTQKWSRITTEFDIATHQRFLNERILQFNDPELTRLAGADILFRTPPFGPKRNEP